MNSQENDRFLGLRRKSEEFTVACYLQTCHGRTQNDTEIAKDHENSESDIKEVLYLFN